jgi:hypothetical protein
VSLQRSASRARFVIPLALSSLASVAVQQSLLGQQAPTQPAIAYLGTLYLAKHLWHELSLSNKRSLPAPPIDLSADEEQPAPVAGKASSDGGERGHGPARRVGEGNSDDDSVQYLSSSDGDELPTNGPGKGREDALGVAANYHCALCSRQAVTRWPHSSCTTGAA